MSMRSSNNIKTGGGMSSMTDLVFLLLIFFIILSTLAKNATDVNLPQGAQNTTSDKEVITTKVEVLPDGKIKINNKPTLFEDIEMMLLNEISEDKTVELHGDMEAHYKNVYEIIKVAKDHNITIALM